MTRRKMVDALWAWAVKWVPGPRSGDEKGNPKLNENKTSYEFDPNQRKKFEEEFADLIKEEIEIDMYKFSLDQFGDAKISKEEK